MSCAMSLAIRFNKTRVKVYSFIFFFDTHARKDFIYIYIYIFSRASSFPRAADGYEESLPSRARAYVIRMFVFRFREAPYFFLFFSVTIMIELALLLYLEQNFVCKLDGYVNALWLRKDL